MWTRKKENGGTKGKRRRKKELKTRRNRGKMRERMRRIKCGKVESKKRK